METFILCLVMLLSGFMINNKLVDFRHQVLSILIDQVLSSDSCSLFLRSFTFWIHLFLLVLCYCFTLRLSSWLNRWGLHCQWLIATFLLSIHGFLLHQGLHAPILILEENSLLIQIRHLVFLLCFWPKILSYRLFTLSLCLCIDLTIFLLNFLDHLLFC